jgi:hypothetical protein
MKTLVKMVKAYLVGEQDQWDLYLGCLAGAYRSTPHESTRMSPNLLTIGREIRLPADLVFGHVNETESEVHNLGDYVLNIKNKMLQAHEVARKYLGTNAKRNKEIYDAKMSFTEYEEGDLIWYLHEVRKVGVSPKLEKAYNGPYVIKVKMSKINFIIQIDEFGTEKMVHHNKLKKYQGNNSPKWAIRLSDALKKSCKMTSNVLKN